MKFQTLKHKLLSLESTIRKNVKNKQLKIEKLLNQTFFPEKSETRVTKISGLCCLPVEELNILPACLLPYTHPIVYSKCIGSGIQTKLSN